MKNDLISRSALIEDIERYMPIGGAKGVFLAIVEEQPTVCNLDKIIKQLERDIEVDKEEFAWNYVAGMEYALEVIKNELEINKTN